MFFFNIQKVESCHNHVGLKVKVPI